MAIRKRTRTPKHVVTKARELWAEGKSPLFIAFETGLDEEHIKRLCDPEEAKRQSRFYARRNILRQRGVKA